jgi:hypothetical protein
MVILTPQNFPRYHRLSSAGVYFHGANLLPEVKTYGEILSFLSGVTLFICTWIAVHGCYYTYLLVGTWVLQIYSFQINIKVPEETWNDYNDGFKVCCVFKLLILLC